jgi:hypothetical protein
VIEARNRADALIYSTEKNLQEHGDQLNDADRRAIEEAIATLRSAMANGLPEQRKLVAATCWAAHLLTIMDNSAAGLRTAAQWATQRTRGLGYGIREIHRSREGFPPIGADNGAAARPPKADPGAFAKGVAGG